MQALAWLLVSLALQAPRADCRPQFAPLDTGTHSGASTLSFWRKEEAGEWDGEGWLGWNPKGDLLQPVRLIVLDRPQDHDDDEDEVSVESVPDVTFAIRCVSNLRAGPIRAARVISRSFEPGKPLKVSLGRRQYELRLDATRQDLSDAQVVLTDGRRTQILYATGGFVDDPHFDIVWAGDLDGDGRLDLIVNLNKKYSVHPYRLLLSTSAAAGQLVGDAALFVTMD